MSCFIVKWFCATQEVGVYLNFCVLGISCICCLIHFTRILDHFTLNFCVSIVPFTCCWVHDQSYWTVNNPVCCMSALTAFNPLKTKWNWTTLFSERFLKNLFGNRMVLPKKTGLLAFRRFCVFQILDLSGMYLDPIFVPIVKAWTTVEED
jgi:hypothetical protein